LAFCWASPLFTWPGMSLVISEVCSALPKELLHVS
jgi:hypothetical protein